MKRFFALILALILTLSALPAAFAEPLPGDLTGDGKVNGKDVTLLLRFVAGGYGVELDDGLADLDRDGQVGAKDIVFLQRAIIGGYGAELTLPPLTQAQEILLAYAEAMMARGVRLQYDDTRLIPNPVYNRFYTDTTTPEDHTSQNTGYTNCAAFAYNTYYFALGHKMQYTYTSGLITVDDETRVMYHKVTGKETPAEKAALQKQFLESLQPGDIIVYRHTNYTKGHAQLYVGGGRVIHSTTPGGGGNYNYETRTEYREPNGSITEMDVHRFFDEDYSRRFFGGIVNQFAILRPLNKWDGAIPQQSLERMEHLRGVMVEKLCTKTVGQNIAPGEELTYTILMRNDNDAPVTLEVRDAVPERTSFVSGCDNVSGSDLFWTVTVPAGQTGSVAYTVRVNGDAERGQRIYGDKATVGGVICRCPTVYVGGHLTDDEKAAVAGVSASTTSEKRGWALVSEIYDDAVGMRVTDVLPSPQEVFAALFKPSTSTAGTFYLTNSTPYFYGVAPTMFGGRLVRKGSSNAIYDGVRTHLPYFNQIETGDIVVCTDSTADAPDEADCSMYLITGADSLLCLTDETLTRLTGAEAQAILDATIGCSKFAILRPAALR